MRFVVQVDTSAYILPPASRKLSTKTKVSRKRVTCWCMRSISVGRDGDLRTPAPEQRRLERVCSRADLSGSDDPHSDILGLSRFDTGAVDIYDWLGTSANGRGTIQISGEKSPRRDRSPLARQETWHGGSHECARPLACHTARPSSGMAAPLKPLNSVRFKSSLDQSISSVRVMQYLKSCAIDLLAKRLLRARTGKTGEPSLFLNLWYRVGLRVCVTADRCRPLLGHRRF